MLCLLLLCYQIKKAVKRQDMNKPFAISACTEPIVVAANNVDLFVVVIAPVFKCLNCKCIRKLGFLLSFGERRPQIEVTVENLFRIRTVEIDNLGSRCS